jgi:retron-type reverse transcriptase
MDNIVALHHDLARKSYRHGGYRAFKINDPQPRDIHKATVRDRLVHHAIYRILYPYFDRKFIFDSYSCRVNKGTHRAIDRLRVLAGKVSKNHTRTAWLLKCDIRKFFANIDHQLLIEIIKHQVDDADVLWLLTEVIESFHTDGKHDIGLPLGNLTSQLLVNIYMNVFDHYVKRKLNVNYYIRYADDFVILHEQQGYLEDLLPRISLFLAEKLHLALHPDKVFIATLASGVDFLGWIHFPHHRVLRTTTKRRMLRKLEQVDKEESISSYLGVLSYGDAYELAELVRLSRDKGKNTGHNA